MLALLLTLALRQADEPPAPEREKIDTVQITRGASAWELEWSDAEDRLHGSIRPLEPVEGKPLELSVMVGTFQGQPEFDGPVTITMRCEGWSDTQTVRRAKGERAWFVKFEPHGDGECSIDLGFSTTRHKLLHSKLYLAPAPLSRLPWYLLLGLIVVGAFGFGIRSLFKKPEHA